MKSVVVTGSAQGLGRAYVEGFLARGASVVVSDINQERLDATASELGRQGPRVLGVHVDVRDRTSVESLWQQATDAFGSIEVWVNNAGVGAGAHPIWELPDVPIDNVLRTNLIGTMLGCQVAIAGMLRQGRGRVWNIGGLGADGRVQPGTAAYGTTKNAVAYLTKAIAKDLAGTGVFVGCLSPGIVFTDMLVRDLGNDHKVRRTALRVFDILADRPEVVGPWAVDQMLGPMRRGGHVQRLTPWLAGKRFAAAGLRRDRRLPDLWTAAGEH